MRKEPTSSGRWRVKIWAISRALISTIARPLSWTRCGIGPKGNWRGSPSSNAHQQADFFLDLGDLASPRDTSPRSGEPRVRPVHPDESVHSIIGFRWPATCVSLAEIG